MRINLNRFLVLALLIVAQRGYAQDFINLDFESAQLVPVSGGVQFSAAFPGWTASIGGDAPTIALYNNFALDSSSIGICDIHNPFSNPPVIQGSYTAMLQAGWLWGHPGQSVSTTLSQAGRVPLGTHSLRFEAVVLGLSSPVFGVTLNGQPLSLIPLSATGNVTEYGADITAWPGQVATMAFTAFFQVPHNSVNTLFLDAIQFSPFSVPEPSPLSLFALGAFLIFRAKRHS